MRKIHLQKELLDLIEEIGMNIKSTLFFDVYAVEKVGVRIVDNLGKEYTKGNFERLMYLLERVAVIEGLAMHVRYGDDELEINHTKYNFRKYHVQFL